jgi:hypothetical protein
LIADGLQGGFASLYIGALLAVSVLNLLLAQHPELTGHATLESRKHTTASWFNLGALVLALIISFFSAAAAIWALLLLFPAGFIAGRVIRKAEQVAPAER